MSSQSTQRVRKIASPCSLKQQGPMRATFPFGLRQGSSPTAPRSTSGRKSSPSSSPTPPWGPESHRKNPRSPDHRSSPDRASPSSPFIKEKSRPVRHSPVSLIKRTNSLDTIATPYLKGEWPRETVVPFHTLAVPLISLTSEKATQTPDEWADPTDRKKKNSHTRSTSLGNGETLIKKETIKARLAKSKEGRVSTSGIQRTSPVQGNHAAISTVTVSTATVAPVTLHSKAVNIPLHIPKPTIHMRGSVEGLSQEIETLVLRNTSGIHTDYLFRTHNPTPDGHRAPIAELLTTRTVDTQTPMGSAVEDPLFPLGIHEEVEELDEHCCSSTSGESTRSSSGSSQDSRPQSESPASLPIIPGQMDSSRPSSNSGPSKGLKYEKECDSPDLKSIFVREPPDGCEKVKTVHEENLSVLKDHKRSGAASSKDSLFCPIKTSEIYCFPSIPSEVSAFCPLLKPYVLQPSEMALKKSTLGSGHNALDGQ